MSPLSRRRLVTGGLAAAGVTAAAALAKWMGFVPPDGVGVFAPGATLTYATLRLLAGNALAREFPRDMISAKPFANEVDPLPPEFARHRAEGFANWTLEVGGMVDRPATFSLADIKRHPVHRQVTEIACEEGWSYVAEWSGALLSDVLAAAGVQPGARFVVYHSIGADWWDSLDLVEASHPQTLLAWGMNGGDLPAPFGGPLRMRVPRQLGYKSVKYITRLTLTDSLARFGKGRGSSNGDSGYQWYAGI